MEDMNLNEQNNLDEMEGGFAVVDRERLIEEETRGVIPWHKYFIEAFTSPSKMMEECYGQEPYRGASYGVVGCILFTAIYSLLTLINPVTKATLFENWRALGTISEENLSQTYSVTVISGSIGGVVGVFFGVLFSAIAIQIIKAIAKDKASFGNIFKMLLIVQMVSTAVGIIDAGVAYVLGINVGVFQISTLLGDISQYPVALQAFFALLSLTNVISFVWLAIGYRSITHVTTKKAVIVAIIDQVIVYLVTFASLNLGQIFQGMTNMQ